MPEEIIQVEDQYYILATSSRADNRARVIKDGDSFAVFDTAGSIRPVGLVEQGIYHDGTRFLSRFELALHGKRLPTSRRSSTASFRKSRRPGPVPSGSPGLRLSSGSRLSP